MPEGHENSTISQNATHIRDEPNRNVEKKILNRPVITLEVCQENIRGVEFGCNFLVQNFGTTHIVIKSIRPSFCEGVTLRDICSQTTSEIRKSFERYDSMYEELSNCDKKDGFSVKKTS
jgi:hypothetical protein